MNKTNVYGKLSKIRLELQNRQLKKSGQNKFAGFKYYELGDILPTINELSDKYGKRQRRMCVGRTVRWRRIQSAAHT